MDQIKIGRFIQETRKNKNITQKELADRLGVTDKTVSRWENGHYLPDISLWKELCEILEIGVLDLINGEQINDKNISKQEMESSIFNTVKITNKKINSMKKKIIIILCIALFIIIGTIAISIYHISKNKKEDFIPIQFTSRYASIEKEDGWVCSFHINNYEFSDYYHYDCENLKYQSLYGYQGTITNDDGSSYKIDTLWISYVWSDRYTSDITTISNYFNENKFSGTITMNDVEALKLKSDIDKKEIVDLYNQAVVAKKVTKFGNFIDFQPVKVTESKVINDYQWIFGYKVEHGELVNVYLDIKYKNIWLSEIEFKTEEQQAMLNIIPEIEKFILKNQTLKLPKKYDINRNYTNLIHMLGNIKKVDYND